MKYAVAVSQVDAFAASPLSHTPSPYEFERMTGRLSAVAERARETLAARFREAMPRDAVRRAVMLPESDAPAFVVDGAFTDAECDALVALAEGQGFSAAPVNVDGDKQRIIPELRNNDQTLLDDPITAALVWARVAEFFPDRIGEWTRTALNDRMRVLRYDAGQKFEAHMDGPDTRGTQRSFFTFQLYLTDGFREGATQFIAREDAASGVEVRPVTGRVLAFAHGVLHRGSSPVGGRKYVLRTEVMYARPAA